MPTDDSAALARASAEQMYAADAASQGLGITLEEVLPGGATARMRVTDAMTNGHAMVHGGFVFLLADTAFAFAANTFGVPAVSRAGSITFIRPVYAGDELVATATQRLREERNGIYDVTVRASGGGVVAEFRGHSRELTESP